MKLWMKNLLAGLRSDYRTDLQGDGVFSHSEKFPITVLCDKIGEPLEVHYLDQGIPQVMEAQLASRPNDQFFYISLHKSNMGIVYWNTTHADGRHSGVKLIKQGGKVIYENIHMEFDYSRAEHFSRKRAGTMPMRTITREYLTGMFG